MRRYYSFVYVTCLHGLFKEEAKVFMTLGKKAGKAILYEEFSAVGAGENSL